MDQPLQAMHDVRDALGKQAALLACELGNAETFEKSKVEALSAIIQTLAKATAIADSYGKLLTEEGEAQAEKDAKAFLVAIEERIVDIARQRFEQMVGENRKDTGNCKS